MSWVYKALAGAILFLILNKILGKYMNYLIIAVIVLLIIRWVADMYWNERDKHEW